MAPGVINRLNSLKIDMIFHTFQVAHWTGNPETRVQSPVGAKVFYFPAALLSNLADET